MHQPTCVFIERTVSTYKHVRWEHHTSHTRRCVFQEELRSSINLSTAKINNCFGKQTRFGNMNVDERHTTFPFSRYLCQLRRLFLIVQVDEISLTTPWNTGFGRFPAQFEDAMHCLTFSLKRMRRARRWVWNLWRWNIGMIIDAIWYESSVGRPKRFYNVILQFRYIYRVLVILVFLFAYRASKNISGSNRM